MGKFILKEDAIIKFGKHKDYPVSEILAKDPQYIIWVNSNIDWLEVDENLLNKALTLQGESDMARAGQQALNFSYNHGRDFMPPSDYYFN